VRLSAFPSRKRRGAQEWIFLSVLACNVAFAAVRPVFPGENSAYFPLFSWQLFARVPNQTSEVMVFVEAANGKAFDPPVDIRKMAGMRTWQATRNYIPYNEILDGLDGKRSPANVREMVLQIRKRYLGQFSDVRLSLRRIEWDPIEKWKTDANRSSVALAYFDMRD
jgi:hypothetical protein